MYAVAIGFNKLNINAIPLKCVSMSNQECNVRTVTMNINSNEPLFYPYSILVNIFSDSCNNNNDPLSKLCVSDVVKNINIKVFNLTSITNETRYVSCMKPVHVTVD